MRERHVLRCVDPVHRGCFLVGFTSCSPFVPCFSRDVRRARVFESLTEAERVVWETQRRNPMGTGLAAIPLRMEPVDLALVLAAAAEAA